MQIQFVQRKGERESAKRDRLKAACGKYRITWLITWKKCFKSNKSEQNMNMKYEYEIAEHNVDADDRLIGSKREGRECSLASLNAFSKKEKIV